jgi:1-acyl-sn-glycerol-3-phosphate acyltransferase
VAETRATEPEARRVLVATILERVAEVVAVPPDDLILAPPHTVPKTSSGKIRRAAARELYLRGGFARRGPSWRTRARLVASRALHALRPLTGLARTPYALYVALVAVVLTLRYWLPTALLPGGAGARRRARRGSRTLLRLIGCRISVEGQAHLAGLEGPLILASNHTSYLDIVALLALVPLDLAFVAKREVLRWPLVGTFARKGGHLFVERVEASASVSDAARVTEALRAGAALAFFPEGTFTSAAGLRPFRLGAFKAAAEARCPIVPLALVGARGVLRGDRLVPRPGPIHLWIGSPIAAPQGTTFRDIVELRDRVATVIAAHCGEPRLDLAAALPPR